ncbi:hypothetical protein IPL85_05370 [Candidatus Saccharibacteria bacterium]|nr:MAG: hypothetical protein IPL85_05370 [Candidatus Saccharibacteria bacterium]
MLSFAVSVIVPLVVYVTAEKLLGSHPRERWLLLVACGLFFVSYFVKSPLVHGEQTQYMTHFIGGGLFTGFLWVYILRTQLRRISPAAELATLFALVCTLGVANELFEVVLFWLGLMPAGITDTSWDLVANTTGALVFYIFYKGISWLRSDSTK